MIPEGVQITSHAWERFIERIQAISSDFPCCPMMTLQVIMDNCQPEDLGAGAVIRMLKNGFQPAVYYRHGPLRLVLDEEQKRLITIEIATLKRPKKKGCRRKRQ